MDSFNHYAQQFIRFVNFDLHYDPLDECCFDNKVAGIWNMYGVLITLFCADTMTAVDELEASKGNRKYWLHSLLTVVFKGFAGGCLAPMFIGKAPMIIADDIALLSCIVTWYVVHNTALVKLLVQEPIRGVFAFLLKILF